MDQATLDVHPFTDQGRRDYQEDYFYTAPAHRTDVAWLGIVADGMGGEQNGDLASRTGVHALRSAFEAAVAAGQPVAAALREGTESGHQAVVEAARRVGSAGNMGSTVVAFAVDGGTLHWCSAGDSRLYLFRDGKLVQLSRDFTLAEDMIRGMADGDWTPEEIAASPQRKALTSFMGTDRWRCDQGSRALQPGDVLVACTDGVFGTIESEGIGTACAGRSAQAIAEDLHQRVLAAAKANQDNATALVVRIGSPAVAATPRRRALLMGGVGVAALAAAGGVYRAVSTPPAAGPVASSAPGPVAAAPVPPAVVPPASAPASAPDATSTVPDKTARDVLAVLKFLDGRFATNKETAEGVLKQLEETRPDRERVRSDPDAKTRGQVDSLAASLFERAWLKRTRDELAQARGTKAPAPAVETLQRVTSNGRKAEMLRLGKPAQQEAAQLLQQAETLLNKRRKELDAQKKTSESPQNKDAQNPSNKPEVKTEGPAPPPAGNTDNTPFKAPEAGPANGAAPATVQAPAPAPAAPTPATPAASAPPAPRAEVKPPQPSAPASDADKARDFSPER